MIVPKRQTSKGRKNRRRAHHALKDIKRILFGNKKTGKFVRRHRIDPNTGMYRGLLVKNAD